MACSKDECKDCLLIEAEGTVDEVITPIGTLCGDEMKEIDGKTYHGSNAPARSYCE